MSEDFYLRLDQSLGRPCTLDRVPPEDHAQWPLHQVAGRDTFSNGEPDRSQWKEGPWL
jgi:hypothetical protein